MVTVVIPTYNSSKTIKRTIDSVINQTYTDWEILVVDDCSSDRTQRIVRDYTKKNDKIRLIVNEKNQGVGVTRHVGIENANGEWITFLDSDDELMKDFLQTCIMLQQQHDSDMVYTSINIVFPGNIPNKKLNVPDLIMEGEATIQLQLMEEMRFLTGNLYRKTLLEKIPWCYDRVAEDIQTGFYAMYESNKVRSTSYSGYNHIYREGSLLANKPLFYRFCLSNLVQCQMTDFLIQKGAEKFWKHFLIKQCQYQNQMCEHLRLTKEIDDKQYRESLDNWKKLSQWYKDREMYIKEIGMSVNEYYR